MSAEVTREIVEEIDLYRVKKDAKKNKIMLLARYWRRPEEIGYKDALNHLCEQAEKVFTHNDQNVKLVIMRRFIRRAIKVKRNP